MENKIHFKFHHIDLRETGLHMGVGEETRLVRICVSTHAIPSTYMLNVAPSPITCGKEVAAGTCVHNSETCGRHVACRKTCCSHFHQSGLLVNLQFHAALLTTTDKMGSSNYQYQEQCFQAEQSCPSSPFVQSNLIVHTFAQH